jgi:hypothetical protein
VPPADRTVELTESEDCGFDDDGVFRC